MGGPACSTSDAICVQYVSSTCHRAGFPMDGRLKARGLRKARAARRGRAGSVGTVGVEPGPTVATGGRRAVERRPGLPTGDARGRAWSKVNLLRSPSTQHTHDAAGRLLEVGPSVFNLSVSGGPSRFGSAGGRAFWKKEKRKQEGGRGPRPPTGSRKYAQGGQGGGAGKQHQVGAGRMALRVGFEQGFPGFRSVLVSAHIPT